MFDKPKIRLFRMPGGCAEVAGIYRNKCNGFWNVRMVHMPFELSNLIVRSKN